MVAKLFAQDSSPAIFFPKFLGRRSTPNSSSHLFRKVSHRPSWISLTTNQLCRHLATPSDDLGAQSDVSIFGYCIDQRESGLELNAPLLQQLICWTSAGQPPKLMMWRPAGPAETNQQFSRIWPGQITVTSNNGASGNKVSKATEILVNWKKISFTRISVFVKR